MNHRIRGLRLLLAAAVLAAGLGGCGDFWALRDLSSEIRRDFVGADPFLLHSHHGDTVQLTIVLRKSPLATAPEAERRAMARQLAEHARDHFALYAGLRDVNVFFTAGEWPVGEEDPDRPPSGSYTFPIGALGRPVVEVE